MLPPSYLDAMPDAFVQLAQQVEDEILQDVARRIGKMGTLTETANWKLWRYQQTEAVRENVVKLLAKYSGKSEATIRRLLKEAATEAMEREDAIYYHYGLEPTPFEESAALNNLLNAGARQTCGTWQNLTATTANTVSGAFERTLDVAWGKVATGAFDYKTAVKQAVDSLADDMPEITYPSGHTDTLEVAARRAVLTGVNQTAGKLQEARMDEMNVEFVETSAHGGARPSHAEWQGRRFHRGGAVDYLGKHYPDFEQATGYGTGAGLCGWNCRHTFFAVFPELGDPPTWTEESLQELNARNIEYNGKLYTQYEVNQMQRARERNVRKWKKRYLAESAAGSDTTDSAVRLKAARQSLSEFAKATGGRVDSARVSVPKFGRSEASKAGWAAKGTARNESSEQYYRPVTRGSSENFAFKSGQELTARRVESYSANVYISDDAKIKPRALHTIAQNTEKAVKQWGVSQKPTIVIVSEREMPTALGKYDPVSNVVYYTPQVADARITSTTGGKGSVEFHEMWHMKQADIFRQSGWNITEENRRDYIIALCEHCKKNIDAAGITRYNVSDISEYALRNFLTGRFDEVEAEYMTFRRRDL